MLMDQSSRDDTLAGFGPPPVTPGDAVYVSPRRTSKRSVPGGLPMKKEGSPMRRAPRPSRRRTGVLASLPPVVFSVNPTRAVQLLPEHQLNGRPLSPLR